MFISQAVTVGVAFDAASALLADLTGGTALHAASTAAYDQGVEMLVRVGPFGEAPAVSKLVRIRLLQPVARDSTLTLSLRWEATGPTSALFPALDADLILSPEDEHRSRLGLVGSYRPPLGGAGAVLDKAILRRVAAATIRSLLDTVATSVENTARVRAN